MAKKTWLDMGLYTFHLKARTVEVTSDIARINTGGLAISTGLGNDANGVWLLSYRDFHRLVERCPNGVRVCYAE